MLTGACILPFMGVPALEGVQYFFVEPLRDAYGLSELSLKVVPIYICALGLLLCFRSGVWNIGAEGQFLAGAMTAGATALWLESVVFPGAWVLVLLAGCVGGALYAGCAALLKTGFGVSEILSTIMLNYIAVHLLMYLVNGPLKDPNGYAFPESALFSPHTQLPLFSESVRANLLLVFPFVLGPLVWWVLKYTRLGFELRLLGRSPAAAKNAGIAPTRIVLFVLITCVPWPVWPEAARWQAQ